MSLTRRLVATTATATVGVLGLGAAFAAGMWWADSPGPGEAPGSVDVRLGTGDGSPFRLAGAELRPATCSQLLTHYLDGNLAQVGPYGWGGTWGPPIYALGGGQAELESGAPAAASRAPGMEGQGSSGSGTNVQEAGVDEPDVVKTDGALLVRVADGTLTTYDVTGDEPVRLGRLVLPKRLSSPELLLVGDRVVVLSTELGWVQHGIWGPESPSETTYQVDVDVSDPAAPAITRERSWNARLVSARLHGTVVRLVLRSGLPELDFVRPRLWRGEQTATERNRRIVKDSTIADWVPQVTDADGTRPVADCADIAIPDDAPPTGGIYVVGFDAAADPDGSTTDSVTGLATGTDTAYASDDRLYVATGGFGGGFGGPVCCVDVLPDDAIGEDLRLSPTWPAWKDTGRTALHAFALDGVETRYVASGEVDGTVADRWAMDEYDDVLRVAVGPSVATGNFNSVLTLQERGDDLVQIGSVDKLGVNETIQSMRWFDGLAVMVTFRQVDPLYAIDLTDPRSPRTLGKLKIPGFSSYLHPLDGRWLLGIGQAADGSAQAALFDLSDLSSPKRTDWLTYPKGSWAAAGSDPRQFTWLPERRTALTVVSRGWEGQTGWISVLRVRDGKLGNEMIEADYGYEVSQLRTVPLPSGEVVLVTSDEVSFLPL